MTLPFTTTWPAKMGDMAGQPNNFVNKIWSGLVAGGNVPTYSDVILGWGVDPNQVVGVPPKLHTIRRDKHNRWRPGMKIHPVVNNRTKNRFQFIHDLVCTAVQEIELKYYKSGIDLLIDGKVFYSPFTDKGMQRLALNDGFPSVEAFFAWFNEDFQGKIIHWTDLRY